MSLQTPYLCLLALLLGVAACTGSPNSSMDSAGSQDSVLTPDTSDNATPLPEVDDSALGEIADTTSVDNAQTGIETVGPGYHPLPDPQYCVDGVAVVPSQADTITPADPDSYLLVADTIEEQTPAPNEAIDQFVRGVMANNKLVGLAVGVVKQQALTYLKGYGLENQEAGLPTLAASTIFRWASISKSMAAIVAVQLASEDLIDLDLPIRNYWADYVPATQYLVPCTADAQREIAGKTYTCNGFYYLVDLPPASRTITLRQLLGHLGGIPHYINGTTYPVPSSIETNDPCVNSGMAWATGLFLGKPLVAIPGSAYNYSTFGFNLIGVILEQATGQSFASLVAQRVATNAAMQTLQPDYEWVSIDHRSRGYRISNGTIVAVGHDDVSWKLAGGGFVSTTKDLALYCRALMGTALLSQAEKTLVWTRQTTTEGQTTSYGMGFVVGSRNGHPYVEHSGGQEGTSTRLRLYTEDNLCIVVMSNTEDSPTSAIVKGIEDIVRQAP